MFSLVSEQHIENDRTDPVLEPPFRATRNYTGPREKQSWWYLKRWSKDRTSCYPVDLQNNDSLNKEKFRTRRSYIWDRRDSKRALRLRFENSDEIGAFMKLTNSYCLICSEDGSQKNFASTVKNDLSPGITVIDTPLAGCRIIGRMCAGNKNGLLLPDTVCDTELEQIQNELPDSVKIQRIEERFSALGNVIACNDSVAIIHPDLDKATEETIVNTLQVEVFRHMIVNNPLVGSYCVLNNLGGLVTAEIGNEELCYLSSLLKVPLYTGTVNNGSKVISSGLVMNDTIAYAGMKTTSKEFTTIESLLHIPKYYPWPPS